MVAPTHSRNAMRLGLAERGRQIASAAARSAACSKRTTSRSRIWRMSTCAAVAGDATAAVLAVAVTTTGAGSGGGGGGGAARPTWPPPGSSGGAGNGVTFGVGAGGAELVLRRPAFDDDEPVTLAHGARDGAAR